ncbi:hypothetical protein JCM8097_004562 [Rhodosporidiobolus ruineniae]
MGSYASALRPSFLSLAADLPKLTTSSSTANGSSAGGAAPSASNCGGSDSPASPSGPSSLSLADRFPTLSFSSGQPSMLFSFDWNSGIDGAYRELGVGEETPDEELLERLKEIVRNELAPPSNERQISGPNPNRPASKRFGAVLLLTCHKLRSSASNPAFDRLGWLQLVNTLYAYEITFSLARTQLPLPFPPASDTNPACSLFCGPIRLSWVEADTQHSKAPPGVYFTGGDAGPQSADPMPKPPSEQMSGEADPDQFRVVFDLPARHRGIDPTRLATLVYDAIDKLEEEEAAAAVAEGSVEVEPKALGKAEQQKLMDDLTASTEQLKSWKVTLDWARGELKRVEGELATRKKELAKLRGKKVVPVRLALPPPPPPPALLPPPPLPPSNPPLPSEVLVKLASYEACEAENVKLRADLAALRSARLALPSSESSTPRTAIHPDRSAFVIDRLSKRLEEVNSWLRRKTDEHFALMLELGGDPRASRPEGESENAADQPQRPAVLAS